VLNDPKSVLTTVGFHQSAVVEVNVIVGNVFVEKHLEKFLPPESWSVPESQIACSETSFPAVVAVLN
jgi:hypothetical protein